MTTARVMRSLRPLLGLAGVCALLGGAAAAPAPRDEGAPIRLELNRLETVGAACRAYLMMENRAEALDSFRLDLFALDLGGVVAQRLAVQLGPVPGGKTVIKLFDFPGVTCESVGSVLLNDVLACEGEAGPRAGCLDEVAVGTRTVPFLR